LQLSIDVNISRKTLQKITIHAVTAIDIFLGIGMLTTSQVHDWRKGRVPYLEKVIQGNLAKISFAMKCFRSWAASKKLKLSETVYLRHTKGPKHKLRFSKSGHPDIEKAYRTHFVSPDIPPA